MHVQYGCGLCAPDGWENFDVSPAITIQRVPVVGAIIRKAVFERVKRFAAFPKNVRYGDIVRGLPLNAESCDMVYCSHTLEHLSLEDCRKAIANTYKILKPDGVFRFVLPDLKRLATEYINGQTSSDFMRSTYFGVEKRSRGIEAAIRAMIGNSAHLWMWDYETLKAELEQVGFVDVRRALIGDNPDPLLRDVEDEQRWHKELGMECRKPCYEDA